MSPRRPGEFGVGRPASYDLPVSSATPTIPPPGTLPEPLVEDMIYVITEQGSGLVPRSQLPPELQATLDEGSAPAPKQKNPIGIVATSVVALVLLGAAAVGTVFVVRRLRGGGSTPSASPSRAATVRAVAAELGAVSANEITDEAYMRLYPSCPPQLDPDDPAQADCRTKWLDLYAIALDVVGDPEAGIAPTSKPTVDRLASFVESVSDDQLDRVRAEVGPSYFDPLMQAVEDEDETGAKRAVRRLKQSIDSMGTLRQASRLLALRNILGDKTDQLAWILG